MPLPTPPRHILDVALRHGFISLAYRIRGSSQLEAGRRLSGVERQAERRS